MGTRNYSDFNDLSISKIGEDRSSRSFNEMVGKVHSRSEHGTDRVRLPFCARHLPELEDEEE